MRVRSLMSNAVFSCTPAQTLADAARLLWEHDVGSVPIVDEANRPLAMLTDRDICMAAYLRGERIGDLAVSTAMSTALFTCHVEDALSQAEQTMMTRQVRRLPVVDDDGVLVGVLSLNDIVLARSRSKLRKVRDWLKGDVIDTLAGISKHRATT